MFQKIYFFNNLFYFLVLFLFNNSSSPAPVNYIARYNWFEFALKTKILKSDFFRSFMSNNFSWWVHVKLTLNKVFLYVSLKHLFIKNRNISWSNSFPNCIIEEKKGGFNGQFVFVRMGQQIDRTRKIEDKGGARGPTLGSQGWWLLEVLSKTCVQKAYHSQG